MKLVVRGDCTCRRGIVMNRDLFGGRPTLVQDEKCRTDFLVDHLSIGSLSEAEVAGVLDLERMGKSLRHYAAHQIDRNTLDVTDADLVVMDNYADMNFPAWRHRRTGHKLWIHPGFLKDEEGFRDEFELLGQLTVEESLDNHVKLIEHYRARSGPIPVLYLSQVISYYPKLDGRSEFASLGAQLERALPDVYDGRLEGPPEPDDLGSCGPGNTLHFTGDTYRAMIESAMRKGLDRWLPPIQAASLS